MYLGKSLEKPETEVVERSRVILANFWDKYANIFHGHQAEWIMGSFSFVVYQKYLSNRRDIFPCKFMML